MVRAPADAPDWAHRFAEEVTRALEAQAALVRLASHQAASLPPAARLARAAIFITDTGRPAWSDGAVWRYADGSLV